MKAIVLAAGRGERMGELTVSEPKPLLAVGDERLIERQLRLLAEAGISEVVINLSYRGDAIRALVGERTRWGQSVTYSLEGDPPLETGGGIIAALPLLGDARFLVANADVYTDFDYAILARAAHEHTLVLVPNPDHHPEGDFGLSTTGIVTREPPRLTYAGIAVLSSALFAGAAPGRQKLRPFLETAIDRGELGGIVHPGLWEDVGTPDRLERARRSVRR